MVCTVEFKNLFKQKPFIFLLLSLSNYLKKLFKIRNMLLLLSNRDRAISYWHIRSRPPRTKRPSADRPPVHLGSDRPSHGQIRTLDQDYNFEVDEWTDFWRWTVHLMDGFGRRTKIIILRWTSGRTFDHGPSTSRTDSDAFFGFRNEASVLVFRL